MLGSYELKVTVQRFTIDLVGSQIKMNLKSKKNVTP